jgi:hypothetical protein
MFDVQNNTLLAHNLAVQLLERLGNMLYAL